jgi:hypothetical protein
MRKQVKMGAVLYAQMCALMLAGDLTCQEIANETGLHLVTVYQYTRELHRFGAAHIVRYEPDRRGRHIVKIYKLGKGKDAARVRMTHAERQQRMRDKRRAVNDPLLQLAA